MPDMVLLAANPDFKPTTSEEKAAWLEAKKKPPMKLDVTTAEENARLSRGLYRVIYETAPAEAGFIPLEERSAKELVEMMLAQGIKTEKQMRKTDMIRLIRQRMDGIEIVDDLYEDDPGEQAAS